MSYIKPFENDFGVYIVYNKSPGQILLRFERHEVRKLVTELHAHIERWDNQKPSTCQKSDLDKIKAAVTEYHHALDMHQHGGVAAHECINKIETILGMNWLPGATIMG